jgi:hypothetical protein
MRPVLIDVSLQSQSNRSNEMTRTLPVSWKIIGLIVFFIAALTAGGCGEATSSQDQARDSDSAPGGDVTPAAAIADVPDGFILAAAPGDATSLSEAKTSASVGDRVVFEARIGGRGEPFTEGAAVFLVADRAIPTCEELHGDGCPTPWDYCCEPKDNLLRNMATVQIVDDAGRPLRGAIKGLSGLDPMASIVVVGTVRQSEEVVFIVDASGIYVEAG